MLHYSEFTHGSAKLHLKDKVLPFGAVEVQSLCRRAWDFPADSRVSTPWRPCSIRRHLKRKGIHSSQGFPKEPLRGLSAFTIYFLHSMSQIREGQHSHQASQHRCSSKLTLSKKSQNLTNYSCEIDVPLKYFRKDSIKL